MAWRCKLVAKQNLGNKIKKGDVITFPVQTNNSAAITLEMMGNAIANFIGESDWKRVQTFAQRSQYDMTIERI